MVSLIYSLTISDAYVLTKINIVNVWIHTYVVISEYLLKEIINHLLCWAYSVLAQKIYITDSKWLHREISDYNSW